MDIEKWANFGFAAMCLAALGLAVWRIVVWLGTRFDPVIKAHMDLVEALKTATPKQTEFMQSIAHNSESQERLLGNLSETQSQVRHELEKQTKLIADQNTALQKIDVVPIENQRLIAKLIERLDKDQ